MWLAHEVDEWLRRAYAKRTSKTPAECGYEHAVYIHSSQGSKADGRDDTCRREDKAGVVAGEGSMRLCLPDRR